VMMLTSDASRQTVVAAIQGGANDYVIKTTLSRDELLKKTRRLVNLGPVRAPLTADAVDNSLKDNVADGGTDSAPAGSPVAAHGAENPDAGEAAALQALMDNWE